MVRALPHGSDTRIDVGRIAAIAAAIAVHATALLMLLMPMAAPQLQAIASKPKPVIRWIEKAPEPIVVVPVVPTTPTPPVTSPPTQITRPTINPPITSAPSVIDMGTEVAIETATASADIAGPATNPGPLPSATLEYVSASSPRYPLNELRNGVQGTVVLRVLVDIDGKPIDVSIETSSGNRNLDRTALQHVLKTWRFKPAMQNGQAVQAYGLVPIAFSLQ